MKYRVVSSPDGSTVQAFTANRGWIDVVAFTSPNHLHWAQKWIERFRDERTVRCQC